MVNITTISRLASLANPPPPKKKGKFVPKMVVCKQPTNMLSFK